MNPSPNKVPNMNKCNIRTLASLTALVLAGTASAAAPTAPTAPTAVLARNACSACHGVGNKIVGPAFADVAKKYAAKAKAKSVLKANIKAGGAGQWGPVPMPAQPNLSDADLKLIVDWLVGGAKP